MDSPVSLLRPAIAASMAKWARVPPLGRNAHEALYRQIHRQAAGEEGIQIAGQNPRLLRLHPGVHLHEHLRSGPPFLHQPRELVGQRWAIHRVNGVKQLQRWCQTTANLSQFPSNGNLSRRKQAAPVSESGGAVQLVIQSAVESALPAEMVMDRGVNGGEFLQGSQAPETERRTLPPSERLM